MQQIKNRIKGKQQKSITPMTTQNVENIGGQATASLNAIGGLMGAPLRIQIEIKEVDNGYTVTGYSQADFRYRLYVAKTTADVLSILSKKFF